MFGSYYIPGMMACRSYFVHIWHHYLYIATIYKHDIDTGGQKYMLGLNKKMCFRKRII